METPKKTDSQQQIDQWLRISERDIFQAQDETGFTVDGLFESIESNPLARLLKIISGLPEMRPDKLEIARIHAQQPDDVLDLNMDAAMDKVLEELISE